MFPDQNTPEAIFLKDLFSKYYQKHLIDSIERVEQREFGYGVFKKKIANRNIAFSSVSEMNSFLRERSPLFFSYSNSYYKFPSRTPTLAKEWLGADIIYEFDADELGLEVPEINGVQWFSAVHLGEAKKQVFRLIDFLEKDFGFPSSELSINFSGKAGYHVHLRSESIRNLNKRARIQLVDYLTGHDLDFELLGFDFEKHYAPLVKSSRGSWVPRLISGAKNFLDRDPKVVAKLTSSPPKKVSQLLSDKKKLFDSLDRGLLTRLDGKKSTDFWRAVFSEALKVSRSPIDRQTSVDLVKIIRVPQTLHGDTGFVAKTIPIEKLKEFDAFSDAIVFDEKFSSEGVKVFVTKAPKFSLAGKEFGPYENEELSVPLYCAVYLIGKGAATLRQ
jgi:DNA primase small subunit